MSCKCQVADGVGICQPPAGSLCVHKSGTTGNPAAEAHSQLLAGGVGVWPGFCRTQQRHPLLRC